MLACCFDKLIAYLDGLLCVKTDSYNTLCSSIFACSALLNSNHFVQIANKGTKHTNNKNKLRNPSKAIIPLGKFFFKIATPKFKFVRYCFNCISNIYLKRKIQCFWAMPRISKCKCLIVSTFHRNICRQIEFFVSVSFHEDNHLVSIFERRSLIFNQWLLMLQLDFSFKILKKLICY